MLKLFIITVAVIIGLATSSPTAQNGHGAEKDLTSTAWKYFDNINDKYIRPNANFLCSYSLNSIRQQALSMCGDIVNAADSVGKMVESNYKSTAQSLVELRKLMGWPNEDLDNLIKLYPDISKGINDLVGHVQLESFKSFCEQLVEEGIKEYVIPGQQEACAKYNEVQINGIPPHIKNVFNDKIQPYLTSFPLNRMFKI